MPRSLVMIEIKQQILRASEVDAKHNYSKEGVNNMNQTWDDIDYELPVLQDGVNVHTSELYRIRDDWLKKLKLISTLDEINETWANRIVSFTKYLLDQQLNYRGEGVMLVGAWCLPEGYQMPSDARVDFLYMPSYIAVSWLALVKQKYPSITSEFKDYDKLFKRGLDFASGRNLSGHGYDADRELLVAVDYLELGDVFKFVKKNPSYSVKFTRATSRARERILRRLDKNESWFSIDVDKAQQALLILDGEVQ